MDGIVLVHGGLSGSWRWAPLLPHLDLPTVTVDLPGRGRRPADLASISLDDCVTAVLEDADDAGFDRFCLVGHSLGGVTITETGHRHPDRVGHLVYVGALVPGPGQTASILMTGGPLADGALPVMAEEPCRALFGNDMTDEEWDDHYATLVPESAGIMNATLSGYSTGIPITYVGMDRDQPVPPTLAAQMVANLGGDRVDYRTIDTGHSVMVTRPAELAAIINEVCPAT